MSDDQDVMPKIDDSLSNSNESDQSDELSIKNEETASHDENQPLDSPEDNSEIEEIKDKSNDKSSSDIPEWGRKDPVSWGKYVERQTKKALSKKHQQEVDELKARIEHIERSSSKSSVSDEDSTLFLDPKTGMPLDAETVEGKAALNEYALEKKRNEYNQQKNNQETQKLLNQNIENLASKLEEASFRDKNLYSMISETIDNSKHSPKHIIDFVANMPGNQVEFLSYLSNNKREWDKITALNPLLQHQQLLGHFSNFIKVSKKSSAPVPISPLSSKISSGNTVRSSATLEGAEVLMREKYCNKG